MFFLLFCPATILERAQKHVVYVFIIANNYKLLLKNNIPITFSARKTEWQLMRETMHD